MNRGNKNSIIDFSNITDTDLYITSGDGDNDSEIDSSELNLSNISWASIVEEEIGNSLNDKILTGSIIKDTFEDNTDTTDKNDNIKNSFIDIDKILGSDVNDLKDLEILEYQTSISSNLRKQIKYTIDNFDKNNNSNSNIDFKDLIRKLEWLKLGSSYLSNKIGLRQYHHEPRKKNKLFPRSSYKFCNYNYECDFNYNIQKYKGCFAQHYVHNIVRADLNALINCIKKVNNSKNFTIDLEFLREFKKSLNTISFVINHMYEELKNITLVSENSIVHMDRTPKKRKGKGNRKKRRTKK